MATKTEAYPDVAIPPGEYLAEEIEARGVSQKDLAELMGRPKNVTNEIVKREEGYNRRNGLTARGSNA